MKIIWFSVRCAVAFWVLRLGLLLLLLSSRLMPKMMPRLHIHLDWLYNEADEGRTAIAAIAQQRPTIH